MFSLYYEMHCQNLPPQKSVSFMIVFELRFYFRILFSIVTILTEKIHISVLLLYMYLCIAYVCTSIQVSFLVCLQVYRIMCVLVFHSLKSILGRLPHEHSAQVFMLIQLTFFSCFKFKNVFILNFVYYFQLRDILLWE